jgi:hypothetical protein
VISRSSPKNRNWPGIGYLIRCAESVKDVTFASTNLADGLGIIWTTRGEAAGHLGGFSICETPAMLRRPCRLTVSLPLEMIDRRIIPPRKCCIPVGLQNGSEARCGKRL